MGSLLTEMTISEAAATMQVLSEHGVESTHLEFLRRYRKGFAGQVAELIKSGQQNEAAAIYLDLSTAIKAVGDITDQQILKNICEKSVHPEVWCAAMQKMTDESYIYDLVRIYTDPKREKANLIGCRKLNKSYLDLLWGNDGYIRVPELMRRRDLVKRVLEEEFDKKK